MPPIGKVNYTIKLYPDPANKANVLSFVVGLRTKSYYVTMWPIDNKPAPKKRTSPSITWSKYEDSPKVAFKQVLKQAGMWDGEGSEIWHSATI